MNTRLQELAEMGAQIVLPSATLVEYMEEHSRKVMEEGIRIGREIERSIINQMLEKPLTVKETAESLNTCENTIRNMIKTGRLKAMTYSSQCMIQPTEVVRFKLDNRIVTQQKD